MNAMRYNISQLSRLTGTSRTVIHEWINHGYLQPSQIVGTRHKFTLAAFEKAERRAMAEAQLKIFEKAEPQNRKIPASFFDNIERYI